MVRFLIRRSLFGILVLWVVSTLVFILFFVAPHNPAKLLAGRLATQQQIDLITHQLGLDLPLHVQYWHFYDRLFHGSLGFSYQSSIPVTTLLLQALPITVSLAIGAALLWLISGVLIGVISARFPRTLLDRLSTLFVLTGLSFPTFVVGLVLLYWLFFRLHTVGVDFFPGGGYVALSEDPLGWFQHMILPWITLAFVSAAAYARLTRGSMLDVLGEDYIRTARAKGLAEQRVIYRHGLRASLTPIVSQFGVDLGTLLSGAIVTENVFGLPGLGQLAVQSITRQDLPTVMGIVLVGSAAIVLANILVDVAYAVLDPRVRLS